VQKFEILQILTILVIYFQATNGNLVQFRQGDIVIGAAFPVHKSGPQDQCGALNEEGWQAVEVMNMVVDEVH